MVLALVGLLTFVLRHPAFADAGPDATTQAQSQNFNFDSVRECVWETDVGNGFRKHATEIGFSGGVGIGVRIFGSTENHDVALGTFHVGTMLTGLLAKDHFWRGNLELLGDAFAGQQFHPKGAYLVGVAPMLRYNFATHSRCVPYLGGGAGVSMTDIRLPDLATDFEFNVQLGAGVHWFFNPHTSVTLEGRWLHLSNAGIQDPNNGVNTALIMLGMNWFF